MVRRVLLGSGEFMKGNDCGSLELQLVCRTHLASWQENRLKTKVKVRIELIPPPPPPPPAPKRKQGAR